MHAAPIPTADPASGRRTAPDDVWTAVRDDYLAGLSAPDCCRRHGVGLSALRARARAEGWRRSDQPWSPPGRHLDPTDEGVELEARVDGDLDQVELHQLSWVAFRRMQRAILRGDAAEALRWRRVRQAMDEEAAEMDRLIAEEEAAQAAFNAGLDSEVLDAALLTAVATAREAVRVACRPDDPNASHASDGVFSSPSLRDGEGDHAQHGGGAPAARAVDNPSVSSAAPPTHLPVAARQGGDPPPLRHDASGRATPSAPESAPGPATVRHAPVPGE